MWLGDQYRRFQAYRAERYLTRHPQLGLDALRRDHELAARAFETMQARQGAEGPERQSFQYPALGSYAFGGRSPMQRTLPKPSPFNIRVFSQYPPARRAIDVISNPILELPFQIALLQPMGKDLKKAQPEPTAEQQARIEAATKMFESPNNEQDGREWMEMELEDLIVLGGGTFEVEANTSDDRPLFLWPVDSQSVRINMQWQPGMNTYRYS